MAYDRVIEVSFGNTKLPRSTAIFNMTTAKDCPSKRLGKCKHPRRCYARKSERQYKDTMPYRERQSKYWAHVSSSEFVRSLVDVSTWRGGGKSKIGRLKISHLRLNESGDFRNQGDVWRAELIARILWRDHGVASYCYTARDDLDYSKVVHLVINGSGFRAYPNGNVFEAVDKPSGRRYVCPGDCSKCDFCTVNGNRTIEVKYH